LQEAGENRLALHRLNVPNTLHHFLLSTNAIESSFLNTRRKIGRVTRFRAETDQASHWLSYALLEAEKGFRRIRGHGHLGSWASAVVDLGFGKIKKFAAKKRSTGLTEENLSNWRTNMPLSGLTRAIPSGSHAA
jgi:hypothetical protein